MNLLRLSHKTINLNAVAMIEHMTKGRLLVTLTCGKETMINAGEAAHVRRQLKLDKKPIVYLPKVESYLTQREQEAWSFIQDNAEQELSIGKIHKHLISHDQVEVLGQTQEALSRLRDLDLIKISHAQST